LGSGSTRQAEQALITMVSTTILKLDLTWWLTHDHGNLEPKRGQILKKKLGRELTRYDPIKNPG